MRRPTLLGQLLRIQTLVVLLACLLLVTGALAAGIILLRKDQDSQLRSLATSLCQTIAAEEREMPRDYLEATRQAFHQSAMPGYRFELWERGGRALESEGSLAGWSAEGIGLARNRNCGSDLPHGWIGGLAYRACLRVCDDGHRVVVVTGEALSRPEMRRAAAGLLAVLPLAVLAGAGIGRILFRRRLKPLQALAGAASALRARPGLALGVGAEPAELADLERAFDTLRADLGEALEREKRFTQEASHELRTSLTVLRARLESLRGVSPASPAGRDEVEGALVDLESLDRLVEALLLLARSETAALPSAPVNLCDLAREVSARQARADGAGPPAPEVLAPDEILVRGSEELLARALGNLVENARRYAGPRARIRIRVSSAAGRGSVSVEDDGPGIPSELRPFGFERF
ncbi:MAG TPA: HAMP domain-containing sensor histidine kinase, partial [Candidatus Polarisedimenticolia bacterium]|nr:HAMP domain-containing sensor histidine kinase [Candidatus Polarisedimenticolia bacterium]